MTTPIGTTEGRRLGETVAERFGITRLLGEARSRLPGSRCLGHTGRGGHIFDLKAILEVDGGEVFV